MTHDTGLNRDNRAARSQGSGQCTRPPGRSLPAGHEFPMIVRSMVTAFVPDGGRGTGHAADDAKPQAYVRDDDPS
ncbi:MAG: hypothetical protein ABSA53_14665 [Streptosporangiaceae bacterium]